MTKITWKPGTMLAPVPPALISCGTMEKPNVMTAAWTGIISSDPVMTYVSIRPSRYSHDIIKESGEFVINLANLPLAKATDFCGIKSGRDTDKFKEAGITAAPCSEIKAPQVLEAPVSIECKVKSVVNYGTHDMFVAEVVAVNVDDKYIDEDGKLWLEKSGLLAYVHGFYYTLGRNLGKFGFSVEKKPKKSPAKDFVVKEESIENAEAASERKTRPERRHTQERRTDEGSRPRRPRDFGNGGERRGRSNDAPRERRSYDDKPREKRNYGDAPRERRSFDDKPRDRRNFDDAPRERRAFDDRKPKRFSDDRRRSFDDRAPRRDNRDGDFRKEERSFDERRPSRSSYSGGKKFDGKTKFEKARRENDKAPASAPRKRYGKLKSN